MKNVRNCLFAILVILFLQGCANTNLTSKLDLITIEYSNQSDSELSLTDNLILPDTIDDYEITWKSSDDSIITNEGLVTRKSENKNVTLTATISQNISTAKKKFDFVVTRLPNENDVFNITFDYFNKFESVSQNINYGLVEEPEEKEIEYYIFDGWYIDDNFSEKWDFLSDYIESDIILYAKYKPLNYSIKYLTFGGQTTNPEFYSIEDETIPLNDATKEGYKFTGWLLNGMPVTEINFSPEDITLVATYELINYSITYENGGDQSNIDSYTIEDGKYGLLDAVKNGYMFMGWYLNSNFNGDVVKEIDTGTSGNLVLYAKWDLINYNITYKTNEGTTNSVTTYNIESETITLDDCYKDDYDFVGWYDQEEDGKKVTTIYKGSYGDVTLYAKFVFNIDDYSQVFLFDLSEINLAYYNQGIAIDSNGNAYREYIDLCDNTTQKTTKSFIQISSFDSLYGSIYDLPEGEQISEVFLNDTKNLIIKTNLNRVLGCGENSNGILGAGSKDSVSLFDITSCLDLEENEIVENIKTYSTYVIAITNFNKVFLWGNYNGIKYPLNITDKFNLADNESFVFEDVNSDDKIIRTNLNNFVPAKELIDAEIDYLNDNRYIVNINDINSNTYSFATYYDSLILVSSTLVDEYNGASMSEYSIDLEDDEEIVTVIKDAVLTSTNRLIVVGNDLTINLSFDDTIASVSLILG
ncbi:MAG: InlB B-repeat-containing protein, partial [Bacilli bacterium]